MKNPLLSNTLFLRLYTAKVLAMFGTGVGTIAIILVNSQLYHNDPHHMVQIAFGTQLGLLFALQMLAKIIGTPLMASLSRFWHEKTFLIAMDIIRAACLVGLMLNHSIMILYVLILIITLCSSGFTPMYNSLLPHVLNQESHYVKALTFNRLAEDIERFVSPLVAIALLLLMPAQWLFIITIGGFICSAILLSQCQLPTIPNQSPLSINTSFKTCYDYIKNKHLRFVLLAACVSSIIGATVIINALTFAVHYQHPQMDMAFLFIAFGLGSAFTATGMHALKKIMSAQAIMILGMLLSAIISGIIAWLVPDWMGFILAIFGLGMASSLIETLMNFIVKQQSVFYSAKALFSANFSLTHGAWLVAYLLAGLGGHHLALSGYFGLICLLSLCLTTLAYLFK